MDRLKAAMLAAVAVLVMVVGSALASNQPREAGTPIQADASQEAIESDDEAPPTQADVAHALDRLEAAGYSTDGDALVALAADHGVGGAVRLVAWTEESGLAIEELVAMRADGMGWGQIARELELHPGIGSIMGNGGGNGLGREGAPGQQKKDDAGD